MLENLSLKSPSNGLRKTAESHNLVNSMYEHNRLYMYEHSRLVKATLTGIAFAIIICFAINDLDALFPFIFGGSDTGLILKSFLLYLPK